MKKLSKKYTKLLSITDSGHWQFTWRGTVYVFPDLFKASESLSSLIELFKS